MVGAAKANVAMMRPAFSDIRATVDDLVAEGDKVAAYVSFTGSTRVRCSDSRQPARRLPSGCCYGVSRDRCPSGPTVSRRLKKVRRLPPSPDRHDCPIVLIAAAAPGNTSRVRPMLFVSEYGRHPVRDALSWRPPMSTGMDWHTAGCQGGASRCCRQGRRASTSRLALPICEGRHRRAVFSPVALLRRGVGRSNIGVTVDRLGIIYPVADRRARAS
jgi:hypothetical protein